MPQNSPSSTKKTVLHSQKSKNIDKKDIFKLENWQELLNSHQPYSGNNPETEDPSFILNKLNSLNNQEKLQEMQDYLATINPYWRGIFEPIFYRHFTVEGKLPADRLPEKVSQDQNDKNTFVLHFPGTQIAKGNMFDPIAMGLYYNNINYRHIDGVANLVFGTGGTKNAATVVKDINEWIQFRIKSGAKIEELSLVCSSFSRGSAVVEVITALHKLHPKLKVHAYLLDPVRGWIDGPNAGTETTTLPPSVKTCQIIYANPKVIDPGFIAATFQREFKPNSKDTLFMGISQNAGHNMVGLFNDNPRKNKQAYASYWLYLKFLVHTGVLDKNTFIPELNDAHVKKWTLPLNDQMMSDNQLKILGTNLNKMNDNDPFKEIIKRAITWANLPLPTAKSNLRSKL
jgi:hypothetical protein